MARRNELLAGSNRGRLRIAKRLNVFCAMPIIRLSRLSRSFRLIFSPYYSVAEYSDFFNLKLDNIAGPNPSIQF
jgi:hypothetical protein